MFAEVDSFCNQYLRITMVTEVFDIFLQSLTPVVWFYQPEAKTICVVCTL